MTKRNNGKGKTWGRFTASKNGESIHLTFTNESEFWDAQWELKHTHGFETRDEFFGYKLYESAADAIEDARRSCRDRDSDRAKLAEVRS